MPRAGTKQLSNSKLGASINDAVQSIVQSASFRYCLAIGQDQCATLLGMRSSELGTVNKTVHDVMEAVERAGHARIEKEERGKGQIFWRLVKEKM